MTISDLEYISTTGKNAKLTISETFLKYCDMTNTDSCIEWNGHLMAENYGVLVFNKKARRSNRLSYELNHQCTIDDNDVVMHTCDNPRCVNPQHLKLGSHSDNVADKVSKLRQAKNEQNGNSKVNMSIVNEIRNKRASGYMLKDISSQYGISISQVSKISRGLYWHV